MNPNNNIINTLEKEGERVTSTYAEIYFDDEYCDENEESLDINESGSLKELKKPDDEAGSDTWVSPSDLLIGIIELKPPFTSKITRGRTHEGILAIGDEVLQAERNKFDERLTQLLHENDGAWAYIMEHEKASVSKRVNKIYDDIFEQKSKIMQKEMMIFYEKTLQELEDHIKTEVSEVLIDVHAKIVDDLNSEILKRLAKEKTVLEKVLQDRYKSELDKIKLYYTLLYNNELNRNQELINKSIVERNDAIQAFYRQMNAENITSVMYVMSIERKKCRIKQFIMKNYQDLEIKEKLQKLKEKNELIDFYKERDVNIADVNKEWEEKIKKILQIFLRFISFSMKLLPEQATFLLDLEKMVVLQLNEIQKRPKNASQLLVDETNLFRFDCCDIKENVCDKEPFVISGDSAETIPTRFGSKETIPSDKELPFVRLQRRYIYAKCEKFQEVQEFLEAQKCKCRVPVESPPPPPPPPLKKQYSQSSSKKSRSSSCMPDKKESSIELLEIDDFKRMKDCPARHCTDWVTRMSFPYLNSYLDFTEENFERVKAILGQPGESRPAPELYDHKAIPRLKLHFAATEDQHISVGTQYSSQEDIIAPDVKCTCNDDGTADEKATLEEKASMTKTINEVLLKRKQSLRRLMQDNPNLLKMFTDESFDFVM